MAAITSDRAAQRTGSTVTFHDPKVNQGSQLYWKASELDGKNILWGSLSFLFLVQV